MLALARVAALLCCTLISAISQALEVPALAGRITDTAGLLDANTKQQYTAMLEAHEAKTGNQIAVLTLASLEGENLEAFTTKVFRAWKLGQKDKNNGVLLLIASKDRKLRIEVGYGLEGTLTDLHSDSIIRDRITPFFKRGDYAQGIGEGLRAMVALLEGEAGTATEDLDPSEDSNPSIDLDDGLFGLDGLFSDSGPPWPVRILMAIMFLFAIGMFALVLGMFTYVALISPGVGWFVFFFLIPFWATLPIVIVGETIAPYLLGIYLIGFPITKLILSRTAWYRKAREDLRTKGSAKIGGFTIGGSSSGGSSSSSRSSSSSSSSSSSFSGGGGSSGGGGASGSW